MNESAASIKVTSFVEHIVEFRSRLLKSVVALVAGSVVGLVYCKEIFHFIQIPLLKVLPEGSHFIATTPFESYVTYLKLAMVFGIFVASPLIFYQVWCFIVPALKESEKKLVLPFSILSALLFVSGAVFGYTVVFPSGFYYISLVLDGTGIALMPAMEDYLNLAISLLFIFGICFELPIFIFILGKIGILNYKKINSMRRYVIVVLFIAAGVLTPGPDVVSQCLLAFPLWFLYELGGLSLKLIKS